MQLNENGLTATLSSYQNAMLQWEQVNASFFVYFR
jgi:hypothetical protein